MSAAVKGWVGLIMVLLAAYAGYTGWRLYENRQHLYGVGAAEPIARHDASHTPTATPDGSAEPVDLWAISLTERSGKQFEFGRLRGKVWVTSFFFSSCPGPCRQINMAIAGLHKELADKDVTFVSITVDPENDTPAVLAAYARGFEADPQRWLFLTGPFGTIRDVCTRVFEMPIDKKVHTERLTLMDRRGKPRGTYHTADAVQMDAMKRKIGELLAEAADAAPAEAQAARE